LKIINAPDTSSILAKIPTAKEMGIQTDFMSFSTVIDDIYQDKLGSVLRETCSNAFDSHISAGKPTAPYDILIEEDMYNAELTISIKDYGVGLTAQDAETYLCTLNSSSKRADPALAGCLGLGAKSPLALTNNFKYFCVKDGLKHTVLFYRQDNAVPIFNIVTEECLDEPVGVTCVYTIKNYTKDIVLKKLKQVLICLNVKPNVYVNNVQLEDNFWYSVEEYMHYYLITDPTYFEDSFKYITQGSNIFTNPYENMLFTHQSNYNRNSNPSAFNFRIIPKFNIGELLFTPSREFITIVSGNEGKLKNKYDLIKQDFNSNVLTHQLSVEIKYPNFTRPEYFTTYIDNLLVIKDYIQRDIRFKMYIKDHLNIRYEECLGLISPQHADNIFIRNLSNIIYTYCSPVNFSMSYTRRTVSTGIYKIILVDRNIPLKTLDTYINTLECNVIFIKAKPSCKRENYVECKAHITRIIQQFSRVEPVDITIEFLSDAHTSFIESLKSARAVSDTPDKIYTGIYTFEESNHRVLRNINPEVPLFENYILVNTDLISPGGTVSKYDYQNHEYFLKNMYESTARVIYYAPSKFNTAASAYIDILKASALNVVEPSVLVAENQELFNFVNVIFTYYLICSSRPELPEFLLFLRNSLKILIESSDQTHAWLRTGYAQDRANLQNLYNKLVDNSSAVLTIINKLVQLNPHGSSKLFFNIYFLIKKLLEDNLENFDFKVFKFYSKTVDQSPPFGLTNLGTPEAKFYFGYTHKRGLNSVYNREYILEFFSTRLPATSFTKDLYREAISITTSDLSEGVDLNSPANKTLLTSLIIDEQFYNLYKVIPINDLQS
jgi:hypothetical protein